MRVICGVEGVDCVGGEEGCGVVIVVGGGDGRRVGGDVAVAGEGDFHE